jgi:hypothetical protein
MPPNSAASASLFAGRRQDGHAKAVSGQLARRGGAHAAAACCDDGYFLICHGGFLFAVDPRIYRRRIRGAAVRDVADQRLLRGARADAVPLFAK